MTRPLVAHFQRLLDYHEWAYDRLLDDCALLADEDYRRPCGLFFGSIHATLNHLAVADRLWLARVLGEAQPYRRLDAEAATDLAGLRRLLLDGVERWQAWLADRTDAELGQVLRYASVTRGEQQRRIDDILTHVVNHGSHHRGQVTAALTAMGQEAPVLDYIYFSPDAPCR